MLFDIIILIGIIAVIVGRHNSKGTKNLMDLFVAAIKYGIQQILVWIVCIGWGLSTRIN